jgi:hypothetical protein
MTHRKIFISGPHNIGYWIAFAVWLICAGKTIGQFLAEGNFTVIGMRSDCEKPLNNRCTFTYTIKNESGSEFETTLSGFQLDPIELEIGNKIEKRIFTLDYTINGNETSWRLERTILFASLAAVLPYYLARRFTPLG